MPPMPDRRFVDEVGVGFDEAVVLDVDVDEPGSGANVGWMLGESRRSDEPNVFVAVTKPIGHGCTSSSASTSSSNWPMYVYGGVLIPIVTSSAFHIAERRFATAATA